MGYGLGRAVMHVCTSLLPPRHTALTNTHCLPRPCPSPAPLLPRPRPPPPPPCPTPSAATTQVSAEFLAVLGPDKLPYLQLVHQLIVCEENMHMEGA